MAHWDEVEEWTGEAPWVAPTRRTPTGEWDDPTWIAASFNEREYRRLRQQDEEQRGRTSPRTARLRPAATARRAS